MSELTRTVFKIESDWQSKTVTTNPPTHTPHLEWALGFTLIAAEPLRVAVIVEMPYEIAWGMVARAPTTTARATAKFFPFDWSKSDGVQVNFELQRAAVTDSQLKDDPRQAVSIVAPPQAQAGQPIPVAALPAHGLTLAVIVLAEADTEQRREGRWRLKPALAEAVGWCGVALASGHQTGTIPK